MRQTSMWICDGHHCALWSDVVFTTAVVGRLGTVLRANVKYPPSKRPDALGVLLTDEKEDLHAPTVRSLADLATAEAPQVRSFPHLK